MSVATCLGLDKPNGPPLMAAVAAWQRWCHQDPDLAVVEDLVELPEWTRRAETAEKDVLLSRLHLMAQFDAEAAVVVTWLLLPGARKLASRLADLSSDIDVLVSGALWIRVRTRPASRCVASTILRDVRQCVLSELGIGEHARRADPAWTRTTTYDDPDHLRSKEDLQPTVAAESESGFLVQAAVLDGAISSTDANLLLSLAQTAEELGTPARRGRAGLMAPVVIEVVTSHWPMSARSIRRRVSEILERLGDFARDRQVADDLSDFVATHDLPPVEMAEFLELYLWDLIEEHLDDFHRESDDSA
jgi:hypothetical protein